MKKILGGLIGAATGDAMGAATEARTTEQILEQFGHRVTDFETPPEDTFSAGSIAGQVTDDFSSAYFIVQAILENDGKINEDAIKNALIHWSEHPQFFDRFAGPTTRMAIKQFKEGIIEDYSGVNISSRQATNGAAMRISPVGLFFLGDLDGAIETAVRITRLTHDNYLAISGACAVIAATCKALEPKVDLYGIMEAGLYGAREGERIGREVSNDIAGPSVVKKMELAIDIGLSLGEHSEKIKDICDLIGTGLHISETVGSAFGIIAANKGAAMPSIIDCVNAGYDTDTLATVAGGICGAYQGAEAFPNHYLQVLEEANGFRLQTLAMGIQKITTGSEVTR
ncbi:MAG: ADP-ribosylglycohydrolase family protein [Tissierellia bacterium]|nr:ADP-ribosylglycohydrolase family protein [Tissierellia bacterium]